MHIHVLQHEAYEGAGLIIEWANANGHAISITEVYNNQQLPAANTFDWLVIMGGAMSVNDEEVYSWLKPEKELVRECVKQGKIILGICLGSQMIASALGKKVYRNDVKEIGWYPIKLTNESSALSWFSHQWNNQLFFHWHGETFDLPDNATHIAYSDGCKHQAFVIDNRIFGLQFHPEVNAQVLNQMVSSGGTELVKDTYVMNAEGILKNAAQIETIRPLLFDLLNKVAQIKSGQHK